MEIYALVGPSGTGKSHRVLEVADRYGIDYIIDDGLFIKDQQVIAGVSSKKEDNKIKAIKRALFAFPEHRRIVREAIGKCNPDRILIVATSERMAEKIVEALELPAPTTIVHIEDIASGEEIAAAMEERNSKGRHVIPVSYIEVKKSFPGQLVGRIWFFRKNGDKRDKTIVRPPFSYLGRVTVKQKVIEDIVDFILAGMDKITDYDYDINFQGEFIDIEVSISVRYGVVLPFFTTKLRKKVKGSVGYFTGLEVRSINIKVEEFVL